MRIFLFALIPFCAGMFYYPIWRFFIIFGNGSKLIPLIIAVILSIIVVSTFMYQGNSRFLDIIGTISSWILVLGFLLMIMLLVENIISMRYKVNPRIVVGIIVVILGLGIYFSLHTKVVNLNIQSDKIPRNTKVLLVSDIHTETITSMFHINKIKKLIQSEKPDFVLIVGDLINKPNTGYVDYFSTFKNVNIPIFAVIGNHDVIGNTKIVKKIPKISDIKFLNNESIEINGIQLIGIIDKSLWGKKTLKDVMDKIELNKNPSIFSILLTHQPIGLEKLQDYPVDLEVAGHTHQGQFYGIRKIIKWMNDYAYGRYELGDRIAFVTQGIGTWGLPFRLGTQSEVVIIHLIK